PVDDEEDEPADDPAPRGKQRPAVKAKSKSNTMTFVIIAALLVCVLGGGGVGAWFLFGRDRTNDGLGNKNPDPNASGQSGLAGDVAKLKPVGRFQLGGTHSRTYGHSIQFSDDGNRVAIGIGYDTTRVWDISGDPKPLNEKGNPYGGSIFALSPSGKRLLV